MASMPSGLLRQQTPRLQLAVIALWHPYGGVCSIPNLSIETRKLPSISAEPAGMRIFFRQRWFGMLGNLRRQLGDQCPFSFKPRP